MQRWKTLPQQEALAALKNRVSAPVRVMLITISKPWYDPPWNVKTLKHIFRIDPSWFHWKVLSPISSMDDRGLCHNQDNPKEKHLWIQKSWVAPLRWSESDSHSSTSKIHIQTCLGQSCLGQFKLPQQVALTQFNRQASAQVRGIQLTYRGLLYTTKTPHRPSKVKILWTQHHVWQQHYPNS